MSCVFMAPAAASVENGFYRVSSDTLAPVIRFPDGRTSHLGRRLAARVLRAKIWSIRNDNSQFLAMLTLPPDTALAVDRTLFVLDGVGYRISGGGSGFDTVAPSSGMSFEIPGPPAAARPGHWLGVEPLARRHPGYRLAAQFLPAAHEHSAGDTVKVRFRLSNVGTTTIAFLRGGHNRAARDNQYVFSAYRNGEPVADVGRRMDFGGLLDIRTLKPGEVFEDTVDLRRWFDLSTPGSYQVHGSYLLEFTATSDLTARTVWEDFASADFWIRVK